MWTEDDDKTPSSDDSGELNEEDLDEVSGGAGGCASYPDTIGCTGRH